MDFIIPISAIAHYPQPYTAILSGFPISTGFARQYSDRTTYEREIGWQTAVTSSLVRQQFSFVYEGSPLELDVPVL